MSPGQLRRRILSMIGTPKEPWELAIMASTICYPVTAQQVLSILIDLERDDRAKQVGDCWVRVSADQSKYFQPAERKPFSVFTLGA